MAAATVVARTFGTAAVLSSDNGRPRGHAGFLIAGLDVLIVGAFEEYLFRGVLMRAMMRLTGPLPASPCDEIKHMRSRGSGAEKPGPEPS